MPDDSGLDSSAQAFAIDAARHALSRTGGAAVAGTNLADTAAALLTPILVQAWGERTEVVALRLLFGPLGIERFTWQRDRQGIAKGSSGLRLRMRDFARVASVMANDGRWRGRNIVPSSWVQSSVPTERQGSESLGAFRHIGHALLWTTGVLGGRAVTCACGHGGQFAVCVPSLRLARWHDDLQPPTSADRHSATTLSTSPITDRS